MFDVTIKAARAGGEILRERFGTNLLFERKADKTVVSQADCESEAAIIAIIRKAFPSHAINGEETGASGASDTTWHIDPLDGTTNFMHGIPLCAVSIGVEKEGRFVLGVVYDPFRDELYAAEEGKGATCNGKPIRVSGAALENGITALDASFKGDRSARKHAFLGGLLALGGKPQMLGSNVLQLCEVAGGQCAGSLSDAVHAWDFAAGVVLVREAGGVVTDHLGAPVTAKSVCVIAANTPENHAKLLALARKEYEGYTGI